MPAGLKEEEVVVAKAEKDPTHEAFVAPKKRKKKHIKEELWFVKRCHAVVPHTEVIQFCLTVQKLNGRGG